MAWVGGMMTERKRKEGIVERRINRSNNNRRDIFLTVKRWGGLTAVGCVGFFDVDFCAIVGCGVA
jgi:hypothetical protein